VIEKELPIKITFSKYVKRPKKHQQHIKRIHLYGPADAFPEEIELVADEIAEGGVLTVDDLPLPKEFEVTDRRDIDPVVTVERPKKEKRGRRDDYDD
jgi:hypothetical protein